MLSGRSSKTRLSWRPVALDLSLLNFCDHQDAANLGCGEVHFVAGVQVFGRDAALYFVLVDKDRDCWRSLAERLVLPAPVSSVSCRGGDGWPGEFSKSFPDRLNVYGATAAGKFAGSDQHITRIRYYGRGSTRNDAGDQANYPVRVLFAHASTDKVCALLQ
jgi:hypothetical protein